MNFIFQIDGTGQCAFPFVYAVHDAVMHQKGEFEREVSYHTIDSLKSVNGPGVYPKWCPVGSVEFVHEWFEINGLDIPAPVNIPRSLFELSNMKPTIKNGCESIEKPVFCKSTLKIKDPNNGVFRDRLPDYGQWQCTEIIPDGFAAEYRAFVSNGFIQDVRQYAGDAQTGHNNLEWYIRECIKRWDTRIPAYTVDVGIDKMNMLRLIECHDFYSCGTYGFTGYNCLPQMCSQWYVNHINSQRARVNDLE